MWVRCQVLQKKPNGTYFQFSYSAYECSHQKEEVFFKRMPLQKEKIPRFSSLVFQEWEINENLQSGVSEII